MAYAENDNCHQVLSFVLLLWKDFLMAFSNITDCHHKQMMANEKTDDCLHTGRREGKQPANFRGAGRANTLTTLGSLRRTTAHNFRFAGEKAQPQLPVTEENNISRDPGLPRNKHHCSFRLLKRKSIDLINQ